jgi:hypothetical protein
MRHSSFTLFANHRLMVVSAASFSVKEESRSSKRQTVRYSKDMTITEIAGPKEPWKVERLREAGAMITAGFDRDYLVCREKWANKWRAESDGWVYEK